VKWTESRLRAHGKDGNDCPDDFEQILETAIALEEIVAERNLPCREIHVEKASDDGGQLLFQRLPNNLLLLHSRSSILPASSA